MRIPARTAKFPERRHHEGGFVLPHRPGAGRRSSCTSDSAGEGRKTSVRTTGSGTLGGLRRFVHSDHTFCRASLCTCIEGENTNGTAIQDEPAAADLVERLTPGP